MKNTVDRIVDASALPLSIVIVGVGGADFSNMVSVCVYNPNTAQCVHNVCTMCVQCVFPSRKYWMLMIHHSSTVEGNTCTETLFSLFR